MWFRSRTLASVLVAASCGCSGASNSHPLDGSADVAAISIVLPDALSGCFHSAGVVTVLDGGARDPQCLVGAPAVSFARDVAPILAGCTGEVCHAPWSYDTLFGQRSTACCDQRWLVVPGQPSASHVVQAVTGIGACVPQMPLNEGSLSNAEIATLVAWVCQGALNN